MVFNALRHFGPLPPVMAICALGSVVAVLLFRDPAPIFLYDAAVYWSEAQAIVNGDVGYAVGGLDARGVLTALVYLPASLLASLFGAATAASWAVLVQNAIIIGLAGSVVVPLLVRRIVSIGPAHVAVSSVLTVLMFSGFAPYPLVDLAAIFLILLALLLLSSARSGSLVIGGLALAGAVNLRPAYLVPALLILVVFIVCNWRRAPLPIVGAVGVLATQSVYSWARAGTFSLWPPDVSTVSAIQLNYAAYGVRYDTVAYSASVDPRQWYCSPEMAGAVAGDLPTSTGDLLLTYVQNLPTSVAFAAEKLAATLQWSWATPYATSFQESLRFLGFVAVALTCVGLMVLTHLLMTSKRREFLTPAMLVAVAVGSVVTIIGSSPEARFAAPLVAAGLVGSVAGLAKLTHWPGTRTGVTWICSILVVTVVTVVVGVMGMSHPAPDGDVTAEICQTT